MQVAFEYPPEPLPEHDIAVTKHLSNFLSISAAWYVSQYMA